MIAWLIFILGCGIFLYGLKKRFFSKDNKEYNITYWKRISEDEYNEAKNDKTQYEIQHQINAESVSKAQFMTYCNKHNIKR